MDHPIRPRAAKTPSVSVGFDVERDQNEDRVTILNASSVSGDAFANE